MCPFYCEQTPALPPAFPGHTPPRPFGVHTFTGSLLSEQPVPEQALSVASVDKLRAFRGKCSLELGPSLPAASLFPLGCHLQCLVMRSGTFPCAHWLGGEPLL